MKKVSVIIPMYNSAQNIGECIDSVINQTYKNIEIIVVDDKSIDNSVEIVESKKDARIKLIKQPTNLGVSKARNMGIKEASGEYICFLDADDFWTKDKIEKQISFIEKNDYTFVFGGYEYIKKGKKLRVHVPMSLNYDEALKNTIIHTNTVMFNMKKLKKEDIYMPDIKRGQDTATWWQVLKKGVVAYGLDDVLAYYRVGEGRTLSSNKIIAAKRTWKLYKREDIGRARRVYCYLCYAINACKKRIGIWKK